jgi:hypothetical protein
MADPEIGKASSADALERPFEQKDEEVFLEREALTGSWEEIVDSEKLLDRYFQVSESANELLTGPAKGRADWQVAIQASVKNYQEAATRVASPQQRLAYEQQGMSQEFDRIEKQLVDITAQLQKGGLSYSQNEGLEKRCRQLTNQKNFMKQPYPQLSGDISLANLIELTEEAFESACEKAESATSKTQEQRESLMQSHQNFYQLRIDLLMRAQSSVARAEQETFRRGYADIQNKAREALGLTTLTGQQREACKLLSSPYFQINLGDEGSALIEMPDTLRQYLHTFGDGGGLSSDVLFDFLMKTPIDINITEKIVDLFSTVLSNPELGNQEKKRRIQEFARMLLAINECSLPGGVAEIVNNNALLSIFEAHRSFKEKTIQKSEYDNQLNVFLKYGKKAGSSMTRDDLIDLLDQYHGEFESIFQTNTGGGMDVIDACCSLRTLVDGHFQIENNALVVGGSSHKPAARSDKAEQDGEAVNSERKAPRVRFKSHREVIYHDPSSLEGEVSFQEDDPLTNLPDKNREKVGSELRRLHSAMQGVSSESAQTFSRHLNSFFPKEKDGSPKAVGLTGAVNREPVAHLKQLGGVAGQLMAEVRKDGAEYKAYHAIAELAQISHSEHLRESPDGRLLLVCVRGVVNTAVKNLRSAPRLQVSTRNGV